MPLTKNNLQEEKVKLEKVIKTQNMKISLLQKVLRYINKKLEQNDRRKADASLKNIEDLFS